MSQEESSESIFNEMSDEEFMELGHSAPHTYVGRAIIYKGATDLEEIREATKILKVEDLLMKGGSNG